MSIGEQINPGNLGLIPKQAVWKYLWMTMVGITGNCETGDRVVQTLIKRGDNHENNVFTSVFCLPPHNQK